MIDNFFAMLKKLADHIGRIESEQEMLIRLIIGIAVFAVVILFKNQLSALVIALINKVLFRKSKKAQLSIKESLQKPLSYYWCVAALFAASEVIVPTGTARDKLIVLIKLATICLLGWFVINLINSDYSFVLNGDDSKAKKTAVKFLSNILKVVIAIIVVLLILEQFGITATRIFAALGIGGVAVAFACKDAVENMLSGFIIIYDKPFEVEDFIEVDGESGVVEDITMRTTRLRAVDGSQKIYPNTTMANAKITNWSKIEKRAFNETLWINYKHSNIQISEFCDGIKAVIAAREDVVPDDIRVHFTEFGTHALEIMIFFYVKATAYSDFLKLKNEINLSVKEYADSSDVELAFSSQTIYFGDELKIKK
ncbi:MAG: mechanosensitive ion channel family protein [Clostridium sp.]|nr:mechanosensitive ion channel family protein [Clostridium sp.]